MSGPYDRRPDDDPWGAPNTNPFYWDVHTRTRQGERQMNAGRELDALIAEKVMGWWIYGPLVGPESAVGVPPASDGGHIPIPHYSTEIAAAWEVVEKLRGAWGIGSMASGWSVQLATQQGPYSDKFVSAEADTAALAICLAALRACGKE